MEIPFIEIKNPRWDCEENKSIILDCVHRDSPEEIVTFVASADDCVEYGRVLYKEALKGTYGTISPFSQTDEEKAFAIRCERAVPLASTDWTQLSDVPEKIKLVWAPYRQALRDITEQEGFPTDVVWPEKPE